MLKIKPKLRFPEFDGEWEEKQLRAILEIGTGKSKVQSNESGKYNILGSTGIIGKSHTYDYEGDFILTARVGHYAGKLYKHAGKVNISDNTIYLFNFINKNFIYESLNVFKLEKLVFGSGQPLIKASDLKKLKIRVPVSKEQKKIGVFFSKLDRQIELEEQKLAKLEEQKKGYMQKIFSKELRFKDENGNNYPEWEEKNLKELIDVRDGTHESPKPSKDGYLLVTSKNLKNSKLDLSESYFISKEDYESINQRSKVEIGDILFGMIGTIGNPILLEECDFAIKNVALLKTNDLLEKYYILNFLKSSNISKQFYRMNAGGTQKFIALSTIRDLNIDMPSSEEAIKIGNFFNKVDNLIENQSNKLELLKKRKQGFLQKMFI